MARGPLLAPAALTAEQRALYDEICGGPRASAERPAGPVDASGALTGPFNAMLYSPAVGAPLQRLGAALRYSSLLPDVTRELVILAVAAHHDSVYERAAHQRVAARLGVDEEAFVAIEAGETPAAYPEAAGALELARAILAGTLPDDDEFEQLQEGLGDAAIFELSTLVGYYSTLATQLTLFDVRPLS
ncbi:carboxymuconolactone decarboxylase family protein [Nocardioides sp. Iso805N]|uniref:carboxymuconolactone decarboxylase family protein n=1 Tax=Nocardioides sp. Iso805N TaxID=1283287 RepID=UPI000367BE8B|nr:carboxymuconolactone decarboxylase family protein [Nocardioides sp. Iso805N]